jgi:hypothetical protein
MGTNMGRITYRAFIKANSGRYSGPMVRHTVTKLAKRAIALRFDEKSAPTKPRSFLFADEHAARNRSLQTARFFLVLLLRGGLAPKT